MGSLSFVDARTSAVMNGVRIKAHNSRNLSRMQMAIKNSSDRKMDIRMAPLAPVVRPPIRSSCPLQAKLAGSRTAIGKCCWHLSCIDLGNGLHFSHSMLCPLNSAQKPCFCNQSPSPANSPADLLPILTRMVRERMRSRYGGSRGGRARPRTVQSSTPPSSPQNQGDELQPRPRLRHYSYAIRRCGRGMASRDSHRDVGLHSVISQQRPGSTSHATHFRFHSRLNKPTIAAKVTVVFTEEETSDSDQGTSSEEHSPDMSDQDLRDTQGENTRDVSQETKLRRLYGDDEHADDPQRAGGSSASVALTVECAGSTRDTQKIEGPTGNAEKSAVEKTEDDWELYACPVVEEPPEEEPNN